jgi:hypothetical protein
LSDSDSHLFFGCQTAILTDLAAGNEPSDFIYDDSKPEEIDAKVGDDAPHRYIDLEIKKFVDEKRGGENALIQIVVPPLVYGLGKGYVTFESRCEKDLNLKSFIFQTLQQSQYSNPILDPDQYQSWIQRSFR